MISRIERKNREKDPLIAQSNVRRLFFMFFLFTLILFSLIGRLAYIQIIKGESFYKMAQSQWFKEIPLGIERGTIYDRNMIPLTNRVSGSYLVIFPKTFVKNDENIQKVKDVTGISAWSLKHEKIIGSRPIYLEIKNNDQDLLKSFGQLKGVFPIERKERYDKNGIASHVIGYINKVDNNGSKGIEKQFNEILKENQKDRIGAIVDAQNRIIPGLGYQKLENEENMIGKNIVTTIDYTIQKAVEEEFDKEHENGSVVVLDVESGDILAMVSRPNFNQENVAAYLDSKNKELYNRGIQIAYPPGSIFKIVVAAAALENQVIDFNEHFFCQGYEEFGDIKIKCISYDKGGHGDISFEEAFSKSCNSTFIQIGERVGGAEIMNMARKLGLGGLTNVELPEEISGSLATEDYMKGAGIGNISIGQGTIEATPLQIAAMTSIIANNGMKQDTHLIDSIVDDEGTVLERVSSSKSERVLSEATAQKVRLLMEEVIREGTGRAINWNEIGGAGGKTGSSQAIDDGQDTVHAWFTGYFPSEVPKYVITIVIENGGSGGRVAAPLFDKIAKRIINEKRQ